MAATPAELTAAVNGQAPFVVDLLKALYQKDKNLVLSPYSLVSALALLLPGTDGESRFEIARVIFDQAAKDASAADRHVELFAQTNDANLKTNSETLRIANLLYSHLSFPLNPQYVATLTKRLRAVAKELDFVGKNDVALATINSDVSEATKGLIPSLLDSIDPATRVILVNAIHFKGLWARQFDKSLTTADADFTKSNGQVVKTALMYKKAKFPFYYDEESKAKFVQLDYKPEGGNIAMVVVLPDAGTTLESYIRNSLKAATLQEKLQLLATDADVRLKLPRFKLESTHYLSGPLQGLGVRSVFGPKADLSKLSSASQQLYVDQVIQKAVIEVNEEGTEAAAATAIMMRCMMLSPEEEFTADRPFLYMLVAQHGSARQILFVGTVEDPTKSQ
ncbi:Leukocyte elastase inhibitor [Tyrophagus putrescentiae]|nr:Leukocyte elastase inhibitor [Tyrophagus putrescentiae]